MIVAGKNLMGSMTLELFAFDVSSDFSGDSPATTIACIAMEFLRSGFGSGREMTSGQQVCYVGFLHFCFSFLLSNEIETGILFSWGCLLNSELLIWLLKD